MMAHGCQTSISLRMKGLQTISRSGVYMPFRTPYHMSIASLRSVLRINELAARCRPLIVLLVRNPISEQYYVCVNFDTPKLLILLYLFFYYFFL